MNFEVGSAENTPYLYERRMTSEIHLTMSSATLLFTYLITKVNTSYWSIRKQLRNREVLSQGPNWNWVSAISATLGCKHNPPLPTFRTRFVEISLAICSQLYGELPVGRGLKGRNEPLNSVVVRTQYLHATRGTDAQSQIVRGRTFEQKYGQVLLPCGPSTCFLLLVNILL